MQEGEALDYDPTAYDCLHQVTLDWPCLRCAIGCLLHYLLTFPVDFSQPTSVATSFGILTQTFPADNGLVLAALTY